MGFFEIALGTQWDDGKQFEYEMFPSKDLYFRYEEKTEQKYPKMGDISVHSALTIHRGTNNHSDKARPVLVLGVNAPRANNHEQHDLHVPEASYEELPDDLKSHLMCRIVDELEVIEQGRTVEGLMTGEA